MSAFQVIDGVPTHNLFIGGEWVPSSRNEAAATYNPATDELHARVHQSGARETALAIFAGRDTKNSFTGQPYSRA
jgi:acyl-CoA reductase-like NAD-dependent aldehyde dehydrogenase